MPDETDPRDRVAKLRQLAIESLRNYRGGFRELERVNRDLKSIIWALDGIADSSWTTNLIGQWGSLEATYGSTLGHNRFELTAEEEADTEDVVASLLAAFERYEVPLLPDERPREGDRVQLVQPLPTVDLDANTVGTVVVDYTEYNDGASPVECEVQFGGFEGANAVMTTVPGDHLKVIWRPGYGGLPPAQPPEERGRGRV